MKTVIFQFELIFGVKQKSGTLSNFYKYLIS